MTLLAGRYPIRNGLWSILGQPVNGAQSSTPVRSNLEYLGLGGGLTDTAASLVSGVLTAVAVPVDWGQVISTVSVLTGATAASTPTHSFAVLYAGTNVAAPPIITGSQSVDGLTGAIGASARKDFTLGTAALITPTNAPYGYIWAGVSVTATTAVPSLVTNAGTIAAAAQYQWFTNTLAAGTNTAFAMTAGSALAGTAATTLIYASQKTVAPLVFLS